MSWRRVGLYTPVDDDEYRLRFEVMQNDEGHEMVFLHLKVLQWTPAVMKRLLHDFRVLRQSVTVPLYTYADSDDEKWERFCNHFGWQQLTDVLLENGEKRRLLVHFPNERQPILIEQGRTAGTDHGEQSVGRANAVSPSRLRRRARRAAALADRKRRERTD